MARSGGPDRGRGAARRAPGSRARRPEQRRRTSGTALPPPARARRRRGGITTRAAFLALLVCGMTLALTVPLRQFFAQRQRLEDARRTQQVQAARVAELEAAKRRLQDPAYVEKLARERLRYVRPGEVPFVVIGPSAPGSAEAAGTGGAPQLQPQPEERAWYAQLWRSVEAAGAAPAPSRAPADR